MPLTIPPFVQFQAPMFPLRGLWHNAPPEGDYLITCEIDWLVSPPGNAVQFSVSGNSPVALSQIVALAVDNSLSGADVQFIFSDSGFKLTVPARNQVVAPVFTNGLTFIASAPGALAGDVTAFQILNSMTMPVSIAPAVTQNRSAIVGLAFADGNTQLVPAGINGTLNTLSISVTLTAGASPGNVQVTLIDGTGRNLWANYFTCPADTTLNFPIDLTGLSLRFQNGVVLQISLFTAAGGGIDVNAFYSTP